MYLFTAHWGVSNHRKDQDKASKMATQLINRPAQHKAPQEIMKFIQFIC